MSRCQCSPTCKFTAAPGEPYFLSHDPRPERQAERSAAMAARGRSGGAKTQAAARARKRSVCSLRTVADLLAELERALLLAEDSGGDKIARANAITKIVTSAHDILSRDTERNAERLAKLLADNPHLARHLQAVT
jgi:hypothetical protein